MLETWFAVVFTTFIALALLAGVKFSLMRLAVRAPKLHAAKVPPANLSVSRRGVERE